MAQKGFEDSRQLQASKNMSPAEAGGEPKGSLPFCCLLRASSGGRTKSGHPGLAARADREQRQDVEAKHGPRRSEALSWLPAAPRLPWTNRWVNVADQMATGGRRQHKRVPCVARREPHLKPHLKGWLLQPPGIWQENKLPELSHLVIIFRGIFFKFMYLL